MIYSTSQHPPPPTATHYTSTQEGGMGGGGQEKVEGQQFTRGVENTNMSDLSPVYKLY
jgi:hypothetical protein